MLLDTTEAVFPPAVQSWSKELTDNLHFYGRKEKMQSYITTWPLVCLSGGYANTFQ